ncbi:MAG: hypothetical protein JW889_11300 [Verrucomicrobia bacterium]|nr:hypothetical protein [Verrucomicrobiota bacterium]
MPAQGARPNGARTPWVQGNAKPTPTLKGFHTLDADRLVIEPFDFGLRESTAERVRVRGGTIKGPWRARRTDSAPRGLTVSVNGKRRAHADTLTRLEVSL